MEEAISSRDIFAIYEKENPVIPEEPKAPETLFKLEEEKPAGTEQAPVIPQAAPQAPALPEGFEENLVNKITEAILAKLVPQGGEEK